MTAVTDLARAQARIAALEAENLALRQKLDLLCHKLFGKKSEGVSPDQLRAALPART